MMQMWTAKMMYFWNFSSIRREKNFDFERTSTMFSIMYWVHTNSMAQKAGQEESMKILQKYLAQHSVHRPPFSEAVFDDVDVRVITRYALNTYYRNYKCYLYAFTAKEILSLTSYFGVDHIERPIVPKPLAQSMTEEEWSVKEAEQIEKEQEEEADRQALLAELEAARADADVSDPKTGPLKEMVSKMTADNWADLETKLEMIQSRVLYPSNLKDKTSFVKRK